MLYCPQGSGGGQQQSGYDVESGGPAPVQERADKQLDDFFGQVTNIKVRACAGCCDFGYAVMHASSESHYQGARHQY